MEKRTLIAAILRLVAVAGALALSGCTALQLTYNNANTLARYLAWEYVEPDDEQSEAFQQRVAKLHQWHRAHELPSYVGFLQSASTRVSRGLERGDVEWAMQALRSEYRRVASRAAEDAAPLLVTLRPEQMQTLEKRLAKGEAKYVREWISANPARRERRAVERMVERFEEWTGNLSRTQRGRIEEFVRGHMQIYEVRLEERRRWQKQALELIKRYRNADELAPRLARVFRDPDADRGEAYVREIRRWESDLADLIVELDATLSQEQRTRALRRMARYTEDLRALSQGRGAIAGRSDASAGR